MDYLGDKVRDLDLRQTHCSPFMHWIHCTSHEFTEAVRMTKQLEFVVLSPSSLSLVVI